LGRCEKSKAGRRGYYVAGLPLLNYVSLRPVWVPGAVCRIGRIRLLAGWRKRPLNQVFSLVRFSFVGVTSLPGPSVPGPSDPRPSLPGPSVPGPSVPGPSDPGPSDP